MNNLVISSIDRFGWNEARNWVCSLRDSGYDGDVVLVAYRITDPLLLEKCKEYDIELIAAEVDFRGNPIDHQEQPQHASMVCRNRFFHMGWYLNSIDKKYEWVVSTDLRDVVFQSNPSKWLLCTDDSRKFDHVYIIASSEAQIYEKESWNTEDQQNAFGPIVWGTKMHNQKVKNAGVMTVRGDMAADIFWNIFFTSKHCTYAAGDQAAYNMLLATSFKNHTYVTTHDDGWACQLGTTLDTNKPFMQETAVEDLPIIDSGKFYVPREGKLWRAGTTESNITNKLYTIVHQYDRVRGVREHIDKLYEGR